MKKPLIIFVGILAIGFLLYRFVLPWAFISIGRGPRGSRQRNDTGGNGQPFRCR